LQQQQQQQQQQPPPMRQLMQEPTQQPAQPVRIDAAYNAKCRLLLAALRRQDNAPLRARVLRRRLSAAELVRVPPEALASASVREANERARKEHMQEQLNAFGDTVPTSEAHTCPRCSSTRCATQPMGMKGGWTSSNMEAAVMVTCCDCKSKWQAERADHL
jgi:hypothetical protein